MSTLHELVLQSNDLMTRILLANGEISQELEAELNSVDLATAHKIDAYAHVIERLEREAEYWASQAEIRMRVSKALLKAAEFRKNAIKGAMQAMHKSEVEGVEHRFKLMNASSKKLVIDETKLPDSYKMQVTKWEVDKTRVKADLENGITIEGANLEQSQYIRPFLNRGKK